MFFSDGNVQGLQMPPQPGVSSSLHPTAAAAQPVQSVTESQTAAAVSHWSAVSSSAQPAFNKVLTLPTASYQCISVVNFCVTSQL